MTTHRYDYIIKFKKSYYWAYRLNEDGTETCVSDCYKTSIPMARQDAILDAWRRGLSITTWKGVNPKLMEYNDDK